jgi:hypothetical protein
MKGKNDFFSKKGRGYRALQQIQKRKKKKNHTSSHYIFLFGNFRLVKKKKKKKNNIKRGKMLFFSKRGGRALRLQAPVISTIYIYYRYPLLDIKE